MKMYEREVLEDFTEKKLIEHVLDLQHALSRHVNMDWEGSCKSVQKSNQELREMIKQLHSRMEEQSKRIIELEVELHHAEQYKGLYYDLIMQVEKKVADETRHATAKRMLNRTISECVAAEMISKEGQQDDR